MKDQTLIKLGAGASILTCAISLITVVGAFVVAKKAKKAAREFGAAMMQPMEGGEQVVSDSEFDEVK